MTEDAKGDRDQGYWPEPLENLAYDRVAIVGDLVRGGGGLLLTVGPLLYVPNVHPAFMVILGGLGLLFSYFVVRTTLRLSVRVAVNAEQLKHQGAIGQNRQIAWRDLEALDLRYYSTKRDRDEGWLQLTLTSKTDGKLALDSNLAEFATLAEFVAIAAQRQGVAISASSADNFLFLGVAPRWLKDSQDQA